MFFVLSSLNMLMNKFFDNHEETPIEEQFIFNQSINAVNPIQAASDKAEAEACLALNQVSGSELPVASNIEVLSLVPLTKIMNIDPLSVSLSH